MRPETPAVSPASSRPSASRWRRLSPASPRRTGESLPALLVLLHGELPFRQAAKSAWEALDYIPIILLITIIVTLALAGAAPRRRFHRAPIPVNAVAAILGPVSVLLILLRIIDSPTFGTEDSSHTRYGPVPDLPRPAGRSGDSLWRLSGTWEEGLSLSDLRTRQGVKAGPAHASGDCPESVVAMEAYPLIVPRFLLVYDAFVSREETPAHAASRSSGRVARASLASAAWLLALALVPVAAGAAITVNSLTPSVSLTQAGKHADLSVSFSLKASGDPETVKDLDLSLPPGLFLAPFGSQPCAPEDFDSSECPLTSQVGLIMIYADYEGDPAHLMGTEPVYLLEPTAEEPERLGFAFPIVGTRVEIPVRLRVGSDYGLDLALQELPPSAPVTSAELSLWGVPGGPSHDTHRPLPGECADLTMAKCILPSRPPGAWPVPFLTNPTHCGVPLQAMLALDTYEQPDVIVTSAESMATIGGCDKLSFGPELQVALTSTETSSASGIDLDLRLPSSEGVEILEPAAVRWLGLELPPGFSVNSAAAHALGVCTDAEFGLGTDEPAECPAASRVGTISLDLAGFDAPLEGGAFFGTAESDYYRILLDASGSGERIKLEVLLEPEFEGLPPILEFSELPQIPIRDLELSIEESAHLLVTAPTCGTYLAESAIEPWSFGLPAISSQPLTLNSGPGEGSCSSPPTSTPPSPPPPDPVRPPVARITTHPPKRTARPKMKFKFVSDRPGSTFECKLDKAQWQGCASPKTVRGLAPGKHVFRVRAMDAAGNRGAADRVIWRVVAAQ